MTPVVAKTIKYVTLAIGSIVALLPLTVILMASLKTQQELEQGGPFDLPSSPQWGNYATFFVRGKALEGFMNTGTFQVVHALGAYNTRVAPILLFMGTDIISIYIFIQFMRGIPKELDEAAFLDGANHWRIYRSVIFPLLKPAIATVIIIKGIAIYNEFYIPFLYMPSRNLPVISTALFRFKGPYAASWQVIAAGIIIVVIPTLIIFLLLQRHIYNGLTQGAVK